MTNKEFEGHNYLSLCGYTDADEVEAVNESTQSYESVYQDETGIQKYDLSLTISI